MNDQTETALTIIPAAIDLPALFGRADAIDKLIADIEARARAEAPDLTTAKGRAAIASLANKVAKAKVALDEAGKALTDDWRRQTDAVNAERKKVRDRLDALKLEVRAPLTEWEEAEKSRVEALVERVARLETATADPDAPAADVAALIAKVEAVALDDTWQEFAATAGKAKDSTLTRLRRHHAEAVKREADAAELVRLRAEAAEREAKEQAERDAREAEDRRIAAERAEEERQRHESERAAQIEREKAEAAKRAAKDAEERAAAAAKETEARHAKELADAKAREEAAAQRERDRIAAEQQAEADATAKREKDKKHRARIAASIAEALKPFTDRPADLAAAILSGKIPHVKGEL